MSSWRHVCGCILVSKQLGNDTCPIRGPGHTIEWARYKAGRPAGGQSKVARQTLSKAYKAFQNSEEKWKEIERDGIDGRVHRNFKATVDLEIKIQRGEDLMPA